MKKLLTLIIVSILVFTLTLSVSADKKYAGQTVSVLLKRTPAYKTFREWTPEFEKETGIKVKIDMLPDKAFLNKLKLTLASGAGEYDIVCANVRSVGQMISGGWIKRLDKFLFNREYSSKQFTEGFIDTQLENFKFNGKYYGLPHEPSSNILYYNKKMFKEAGLDPEEGPTSIDELKEYAAKLYKPEKKQYGYVMRSTRKSGQNGFGWLMIWKALGGKWTGYPNRPDYAVLDTPEAIEAAKTYVNLVQDYGPPGISNYGWNESLLAFQQGKIAMWMDGSVFGPRLEDPEKSKVAGNVGYSVIEGNTDQYTVGPTWSFYMTSTCKNEGATWEYMKWLTGKEIVKRQILAGVEGSSARTDVLEDSEVNEILNPDYLKAVKKALGHGDPEYSPLIPQGTQIRDILAIWLSKALGNELSPKEAILKANDKVIKLLKEAGIYKK